MDLLHTFVGPALGIYRYAFGHLSLLPRGNELLVFDPFNNDAMLHYFDDHVVLCQNWLLHVLFNKLQDGAQLQQMDQNFKYACHFL